MPAAPKLTPAEWAAVRAEYEAGAISTNALAKKYGISEGAVRKRAADTAQPGGAWRRSDLGPSIDQAAARAAARAARKALENKAPTSDGANGANGDSAKGDSTNDEGAIVPSAPQFLPPARQKPSYQNPTTQEFADPAFRAALREEIIDGVAEALAKANSQHLENRVGPLKGLFARLATLVSQAITTPDPNDLDAVDRQARAQAALIVGRSDTLGSHLQALIKLSESIQQQERRALGVEERAKRVELSGPGGAPIQTEQMLPVVDLTKLSTADMEALYQAALIVEGGRERPPVPSPPGDPPTIEGSE
jgi:hypothetical protein